MLIVSLACCKHSAQGGHRHTKGDCFRPPGREEMAVRCWELAWVTESVSGTARSQPSHHHWTGRLSSSLLRSSPWGSGHMWCLHTRSPLNRRRRVGATAAVRTALSRLCRLSFSRCVRVPRHSRCWRWAALTAGLSWWTDAPCTWFQTRFGGTV